MLHAPSSGNAISLPVFGCGFRNSGYGSKIACSARDGRAPVTLSPVAARQRASPQSRLRA